ncbi:MAG: hypothetical protein CL878_00040 [Dehalococcoidia bacterium]|nr:hypothetical protein [Dehalococcoidia bacterium]
MNFLPQRWVRGWLRAVILLLASSFLLTISVLSGLAAPGDLPPTSIAQPDSAAALALTINEVLAANRAGMRDEDGHTSDWLELSNPSSQPVALAGFTVTDDPTATAKWQLPAKVLWPGEHLLVWASGKDRSSPGAWHTNFRLNREGGYVGLFAPDGRPIDAVTYGPQRPEVSMGRTTDGSRSWVFFETPTPGVPNRAVPRAGPAAPSVAATPLRGFYEGPVTVTLTVSVPGASLYYSLDGRDPTVAGKPYTGPLVLSETAVLRAVALSDGVPVSQVTTESYLIDELGGLPVLSLVTDPVHLWDEERGIYANPEARGRDWERPATLQWLAQDGNLVFTTGAGLRLHGGMSRSAIGKKSFRLYFRGQYGATKLAAPLFTDSPVQEFDVLVLRAGSNDSMLWWDNAVYVRDQLLRDLHAAMGQAAAHGAWVALYLNGTPWGLYNVTERIDEHFLASHFDHDAWDIIRDGHQEVTAGSGEAWSAFIAWIEAADLSRDADYGAVLTQLDIESFTSYYLLNIWAQTIEWPRFNWYAARPRGPPDARWRVFVWDAEWSLDFARREEAYFVRAINERTALGSIFAALLRNPQYQRYFAIRMEQRLATALAPEHVITRLDALAAAVRPAMTAEARRWGYYAPEVHLANWEHALAQIRRFVAERGPFLRADAAQYLTSQEQHRAQGTLQVQEEHWAGDCAAAPSCALAYAASRADNS